MCNGKCTCAVKCNPCKCEVKAKCLPETDKCDCTQCSNPPKPVAKKPVVIRAISIVGGMALSLHLLALVLLSDAMQVKRVRIGYNKIIEETNAILKKLR